MGEIHEVLLHVTRQEAREGNKPEDTNVTNRPTISESLNCKWWLTVVIYSLFVLAGQSVAVLLGRLYYEKGGNSRLIATFVQTAGFPILSLFYFLSPLKNSTTRSINTSSPSNLVRASVYVAFAILQTTNCMLGSVGMLCLTVSTYSLICASKLGFNAFFSIFINSQKFTPSIVNSVVLLTISSTLLVFQGDSRGTTHVSKVEYAIGFICTIASCVGFGLMFSFTQFFFKKILKQETFKVVVDMMFFPSLVSTSAVLIGICATGEWKVFRREMDEFELGKVSYLMTLIWTAISSQVYLIGSVGLIFKVSSLFSCVVSTLGLPIVPVISVFVFKEEMDGMTVIAMALAIWGFVSYVYQHFLDDCKPKIKNSEPNV